MGKPLIEACVDSYVSCEAAYAGGADRFELCSQLSIGGVTPSSALFLQVKRDFPVPIRVLIRPRAGDFLYSEREFRQICDEIDLFRTLGADGVVIGALGENGELDLKRMREMLRHAEGMKTTLHRAFDKARDAAETLDRAIDLGMDAVLTSGQKASASEGVPLLRELVRRAKDRIEVMAGGGIRADNLRSIYENTGVKAFHTSCRREIKGGMKFLRDEVNLGFGGISENSLFVTDKAEFSACARIVHSLCL